MRAKPSPQVQRIKRLRSRQKTSAWTRDYRPATQATKKEAPTISQATIIRNTKKFGRDLHALSATERDALLVALWLDEVLDVNEQKVLQPYKSPHPLTNFPLAHGMRLPELKGMVDAYERLGELKAYPELKIEIEGEGRKASAPGLFEGDLLLYLKDDQGPYCVNWTIKRTQDQFKIANIGDTEFLQSEKNKKKAWIRHAAEELYYQDAGIPTYQVTSENFNKNLIKNLRASYPYQMRMNESLTGSMPSAEILIRSSCGSGDTLLDLGKYFCRKKGLVFDDWKVIVFTILWRRRLNFDLTKPFFIDAPITISPIDNRESFGKILARQYV